MKISEWEPVLALLVSPKRDHIRGPLAAPVSLVEYGDYEARIAAPRNQSLMRLNSKWAKLSNSSSIILSLP